jgi:hypothetical protein
MAIAGVRPAYQAADLIAAPGAALIAKQLSILR